MRSLWRKRILQYLPVGNHIWLLVDWKVCLVVVLVVFVDGFRFSWPWQLLNYACAKYGCLNMFLSLNHPFLEYVGSLESTHTHLVINGLIIGRSKSPRSQKASVSKNTLSMTSLISTSWHNTGSRKRFQLDCEEANLFPITFKLINLSTCNVCCWIFMY